MMGGSGPCPCQVYYYLRLVDLGLYISTLSVVSALLLLYYQCDGLVGLRIYRLFVIIDIMMASTTHIRIYLYFVVSCCVS